MGYDVYGSAGDMSGFKGCLEQPERFFDQFAYSDLQAAVFGHAALVGPPNIESIMEVIHANGVPPYKGAGLEMPLHFASLRTKLWGPESAEMIQEVTPSLVALGRATLASNGVARKFVKNDTELAALITGVHPKDEYSQHPGQALSSSSGRGVVEIILTGAPRATWSWLRVGRWFTAADGKIMSVEEIASGSVEGNSVQQAANKKAKV